MSRYASPLELEWIDGRLWRVRNQFDYVYGDGPSAVLIHIPAGMITDFASIPRFLWSVLPPAGGYGEAAVIHDHLYQSEGLGLAGMGMPPFTRAQSDAILLDAMKTSGVGWLTRSTIYSGVRVGGALAWDADRKQALKMLAAAAGVQ